MGTAIEEFRRIADNVSCFVDEYGLEPRSVYISCDCDYPSVTVMVDAHPDGPGAISPLPWVRSENDITSADVVQDDIVGEVIHITVQIYEP